MQDQAEDPFTTAVHTNLLVVWLLTGFMGAAYYILPEEAERELWSVKLAIIQWAALVLVGLVAIAGFHVGWWEGRKFLEIPRPLDYLVVVDVLLFLYIIGMTVWKGRRFTTTGLVLYGGQPTRIGYIHKHHVPPRIRIEHPQ